MFKFRTGGSFVRFFAAAGPQLNYMLSATQTYYKQNADYNPDVWNDITKKWVKVGESTITDRYNSIDVMARIDLGLKFQLSQICGPVRGSLWDTDFSTSMLLTGR